ncbi:DUF397 domain-containing protein [Streptomyces sp. LX-29]|uniref:DUF397 domain-containing protein n=1 Tax=Streptomyces sp. LX-29 TaxID=2900152 RepID=UPI00240E725D|nr:DUF397 domain-containing protein [Streptomyces sp. LX-29]WFB07668.1 DUF397 domain-containing protein [Streptomyces sp. LX-29]
MTSPTRISESAWRKSSYSDNTGDECVEVADGIPGVVPVRDSKHPKGPVLVFEAPAWASFVGAVGRGETLAR